jgi:hypothetical protein
MCNTGSTQPGEKQASTNQAIELDYSGLVQLVQPGDRSSPETAQSREGRPPRKANHPEKADLRKALTQVVSRKLA